MFITPSNSSTSIWLLSGSSYSDNGYALIRHIWPALAVFVSYRHIHPVCYLRASYGILRTNNRSLRAHIVRHSYLYPRNGSFESPAYHRKSTYLCLGLLSNERTLYRHYLNSKFFSYFYYLHPLIHPLPSLPLERVTD